jgi:SNF2 family DNA or RNA helicase
VFFNLWWNPSTNDQARDRIVRIGQRKECYIYRLVAKDSVESRLMEILQDKGNIINEIIGQLAVKRPRISEVSDEAKKLLVSIVD